METDVFAASVGRCCPSGCMTLRLCGYLVQNLLWACELQWIRVYIYLLGSSSWLFDAFACVQRSFHLYWLLCQRLKQLNHHPSALTRTSLLKRAVASNLWSFGDGGASDQEVERDCCRWFWWGSICRWMLIWIPCESGSAGCDGAVGGRWELKPDWLGQLPSWKWRSNEAHCSACFHLRLLPFVPVSVSLLFLSVCFSLSLRLLVSAYRSIATTKDLRGHKTNFERNSACALRAHRHGFVSAELDLCVREDRIVSVTDDLSMQEELCNYFWGSNRDSHACDNQSCSLSVLAVWIQWAQTMGVL